MEDFRFAPKRRPGFKIEGIEVRVGGKEPVVFIVFLKWRIKERVIKRRPWRPVFRMYFIKGVGGRLEGKSWVRDWVREA